ncbi:restriction endonuclease [Rhodococcus rhodochrous ATCC 21198]|nr:restriction endonuclease [Rhodococcus aetherivorans]ETT25600.1 restriction endonuclease [Rhodococcus rhodochrous ATCC 21198]NGP27986.1 restriction endonuclease [Rhodococcus aetherivorans]
MTAWVIRAGRHGEREQWCLENGTAGGGWDEVGDLSHCKSRADVRKLLDDAMPGTTSGLRANNAGQLWGLLHVMPGDIVILPRKTTKSLAFGICTKGYEYWPSAPLKHVVSVNWKRDDVPRSAIKDDLLYTLGAIMTIFTASRNEAEVRFRTVIETGTDPGSLALDETAKTQQSTGDAADSDSVVDPVSVPTLETIRDRVRTHVSENFKGHRLSELVADILRVRGFVCDVSPPGPDQGVDILAGSGPLGLDSPTLIVEVKSEEGQIKAPVVRGLQGAMLSNRSDQGLLVAWGGITKDAKREIRTDRLTMRVWDADDVLDQLFDVYEQLPEETRRAIPLKRAWVLDEEAG